MFSNDEHVIDIIAKWHYQKISAVVQKLGYFNNVVQLKCYKGKHSSNGRKVFPESDTEVTCFLQHGPLACCSNCSSLFDFQN